MSCLQSGHRARAALIAKNAFTRLDPETHAVGSFPMYLGKSIRYCTLRIQVCPKEGIETINPTNFREGSGFLGVLFFLWMLCFLDDLDEVVEVTEV